MLFLLATVKPLTVGHDVVAPQLDAAGHRLVVVGSRRRDEQVQTLRQALGIGRLDEGIRGSDDAGTAIVNLPPRRRAGQRARQPNRLDTCHRRDAAGQSPEKQLESILDYWIEDLGAQETTVFFPELWALANHDPHVATLVDGLYARVREPLIELTALINPACTPSERQQLALFMCATMEGLTIFAGNDKPWAPRRQQLKRLAIENFMQLIAGCGRAT